MTIIRAISMGLYIVTLARRRLPSVSVPLLGVKTRSFQTIVAMDIV